MGLPPETIVFLKMVRLLEFSNEEIIRRDETVPAGNILVDGLGVGDVGNIVLRDRRHLSADGLIIVVMTIDSSSGKLLAGPDIISRGFVYMRESEGMIANIREVTKEALSKSDDAKRRDWTLKKTNIRDAIHEYVYEQTKRNPMILPIIMEVNLARLDQQQSSYNY